MLLAKADWSSVAANWAAVGVAVAALAWTAWIRHLDGKADEARSRRNRVWEILNGDASVRSLLALGEPEVDTKTWNGGKQHKRLVLLARTARQLKIAGAPKLAQLLDEALGHASWASGPSDTVSVEERKARDDARDQFLDAVDVFIAERDD